MWMHVPGEQALLPKKKKITLFHEQPPTRHAQFACSGVILSTCGLSSPIMNPATARRPPSVTCSRWWCPTARLSEWAAWATAARWPSETRRAMIRKQGRRPCPTAMSLMVLLMFRAATVRRRGATRSPTSSRRQ